MKAENIKIPSKLEQGKERLIVEVGSGAAPFLQDATQEFKQYFIDNPNVLYFGLDLDPYFVEFGEETVRYNIEDELGEEAGKRFAFIEADGSRLPLGDNCVDELILPNVLGDPRIDKYQGEKGGEVKLKMLREAYRVLKPGGYLTILEDTTPELTRLDKWIERAEEIFDVEAEYNETAGSKPVELNWTPAYTGRRNQLSSFVARLKKI